MLVLPLIDDPFYYLRPSRTNQCYEGFILDPEDILQPVALATMFMHSPSMCPKNWRFSSRSNQLINCDKTKFVAHVDVHHFKPEEIKVKASGENTVIIEAEHEEKQDDQGYISRHFVRRYVVPKDYDISEITSRLSSDGVLSIIVPKIHVEPRQIPITQTGVPAKQNEKKDDGDKVEEKSQ